MVHVDEYDVRGDDLPVACLDGADQRKPDDVVVVAVAQG